MDGASEGELDGTGIENGAAVGSAKEVKCGLKDTDTKLQEG